MKFKIEIDCDNDEFTDDELMFAIARKCEETAAKIMEFELGVDNPLTIKDVNGNTIGRAWLDVPADRYT